MLAVIDDALSTNEVEDLQANRDLMRVCAVTLRDMLRDSDKRIAELEACVRGLTNPLWRKTDFCDSGPHMRCIFCGAIRNYIEGIIEQYFCTNPACPAVIARALVPEVPE